MSMQSEQQPEFPLQWSDGEKLRKVRRYMGLTQQEFADRLGVKGPTYMAWESDRNRIADPKVIAQRLRLMAGVPMWWFLDTEHPHPGGPGNDQESPLSGLNRRPSAYKVGPLPAETAIVYQFPTRVSDDEAATYEDQDEVEAA